MNLKGFFKSIGLPSSLEEIGIQRQDFASTAKKCRRFEGGTVGDFAKLNTADIINILEITN